jgi:hypothetical protein
MKLYADVEYFGTVYKDAEQVAGVWYFQDMNGAMVRFLVQWRVGVLSTPHPVPSWAKSTEAEVVNAF